MVCGICLGLDADSFGNRLDFLYGSDRVGTMDHAEFITVEVRDGITFIVDLNQGRKSVTNDAEWVVERVLEKYPTNRIVYRDSQDQWDELLHNNFQFTGFAPYRGYHP